MGRAVTSQTDLALRAADAGAATSVMTFAGLTLSEANEIVQIIAGLVAIVAGLCASYYHLSRARRGE